MGLEVGGYEERPNWPKMGPSLLIATCLILAVRTARWPALRDTRTSEMDLEAEIDHAAHLAGRVLSRLMSLKPSYFPQRQEPWFQPNDDDVPK